MKRILLISPYEPSNCGTGVQKRLFNHIRALMQFANVDLRVIDLKKDSKRRKISNKRMFYASEILKTLWRGERFLFDSHILQQIESNLNCIDKYDVVYFFRVITAGQLASESTRASLEKTEIWIDFDDIESRALERANTFLHRKNGTLTNLLNLAKIRAYKSLESRLMSFADTVIVCSEIDKLLLEKRSIKATVVVIPNVIDSENVSKHEFSIPARAVDKEVVKILFVGTMSYDPNIDAVKYFVSDILPQVAVRSNKRVEFLIVGFDPPEEIQSLNRLEGITVTGGVDSVADYYKACDFVIAPIRFGGGTRIKILEAYTFNRAVVATPIGCEGLDLEPGEDILIAADAEEFADQCISLMNNPSLAYQLASNGAKKVKVNYSLQRITKSYESMMILLVCSFLS